MAGESPAAVLFDSAGNAIGVYLDGSTYRLEFVGKLRKPDGTIVAPATEDTLVLIKSTDGIKKIVDALPIGDNVIGRTKLTDGTNIVGLILDGSLYRLMTSSKLVAGDDIIGRVKLTDGTEVAEITASNRLRVDPSQAAKGLVFQKLLNGSAEAMNVNGATTPVVFNWSPGSDDVEGMELVFVVEEPTIAFGTTFFGVTGLTNGFLVQAKAEDQSFDIINAKYTRDFFHVAPPGGLDLYSATPDIMKITISLSGLTFKKSGTYPTADFVKVTVRDNISGLDYMTGMFKGVKV